MAANRLKPWQAPMWYGPELDFPPYNCRLDLARHHFPWRRHQILDLIRINTNMRRGLELRLLIRTMARKRNRVLRKARHQQNSCKLL